MLSLHLNFKMGQTSNLGDKIEIFMKKCHFLLLSKSEELLKEGITFKVIAVSLVVAAYAFVIGRSMFGRYYTTLCGVFGMFFVQYCCRNTSRISVEELKEKSEILKNLVRKSPLDSTQKLTSDELETEFWYTRSPTTNRHSKYCDPMGNRKRKTVVAHRTTSSG